MSLFDKMFGSGAAAASADPNTEKRFNELKQKYTSALRVLEQQQVQLLNLHVQDNKLFIRGIAPSDDAKNKVWDQIKLIDPNYSDLTADLQVDPSRSQKGQTAPVADSGGQQYTVKAGDTLSKIAREFYGDANDYMMIYYANQDQIKDPDKIQVGQRLLIPPKELRRGERNTTES